MIYGYVRSSKNQMTEIEQQIQAVQSLTDHIILENNGSGLESLLKAANKKDIIYVTDIDRLVTNNARKAKPILAQLVEKGVKVYEKGKKENEVREVDLKELLKTAEFYENYKPLHLTEDE